ncbi:hypothetical protein FC756_10395 [Lysinibacillus mangiferihumi]|uniref:Uncharacterized protein n=1 Tax=Lysinibacillus mangiferihumi TaxID=1130819 RepID=A0A4U2Z369_9BACI|nr:hypothetical protein [Lysinibacillus mangiferihumi]TKI68548.1 hypothetical protein FC756_10395 [Lysinibacillus mangiferihumi]
MEINTGFNRIFVEFDTDLSHYLTFLAVILSLKLLLSLFFKRKKQLIELIASFALFLLINSLVFNIIDILFIYSDILNLAIIVILLFSYIMFFYQLYKYFKKPKAHE